MIIKIAGDPGATVTHDERLAVFARAADGAMWHRWQVNRNGEWSHWESLGGEFSSGPDAARNADGGLVVFARGMDNAIWHRWQSAPDGEWSHWESLGGTWATDPAAAVNADGGLVVFARGMDNAIWHRWQVTRNGNWSGWESLGGTFVSDPAAALNPDGGLVVFARGTDNAIWHRWQVTRNGNWSGWETLEGGFISGPAACLNAEGGLVVFARGTDGAIWHRWQVTRNGNWSHWESLGGSIASDPAATLGSQGRLVVFGRGADDALWHRWQVTRNGDWSHWESLGSPDVVDATAADLVITDPGESANITGTESGFEVRIAGSARDDQSRIERIEISVDGQPYMVLPRQNYLEWQSTLFFTSLGEHKVTVRCVNCAGGVAERAVSFRTVDTTGPAVSVASPTENARLPVTPGGTDIEISGTVRDTQSGVAAVACEVSTGDRIVASSPATLTPNSDEWRARITLRSAGTYVIKVRATDRAGNSRVETLVLIATTTYIPQEPVPFAYLADLADFATKRLKKSPAGGSVALDDLEQVFLQPFGGLLAPVNRGAAEAPVLQVRTMGIEVARGRTEPCSRSMAPAMTKSAGAGRWGFASFACFTSGAKPCIGRNHRATPSPEPGDHP